MFTKALQARLKVLDDEILRLINLASRAPDRVEQDKHILLAQDIQREARTVRAELQKISGSAADSLPAVPQHAPTPQGSFHKKFC